MFCTLVHADCKNAILRRIQENGKIYRVSLCFITVLVFLLLLFCCWLSAVFVILLTSWKSFCCYFFQLFEMLWKAIFRKRIVICAYLFRRFYHFDSVKRFFLSAFFLFLFVSEVHITGIKVQILCICIHESCMFSSRLADINRMPVMVSGKYCSG